eukprot:CAMPEP_0170262194 /NCGR_PEP_ID=MMETSP0116_2-20130129/30981_1 /TAXON_ID=400756 /ORGANISM="Durinskia baltica, Strain CSIRO CS-38" /LENGTH=213 /DNA_ID=CAMNT_0010513265 /DNA_START=152 /DNA_END=790 /DNA_ORIENTATION=+
MMFFAGCLAPRLCLSHVIRKEGGAIEPPKSWSLAVDMQALTDDAFAASGPAAPSAAQSPTVVDSAPPSIVAPVTGTAAESFSSIGSWASAVLETGGAPSEKHACPADICIDGWAPKPAGAMCREDPCDRILCCDIAATSSKPVTSPSRHTACGPAATVVLICLIVETSVVLFAVVYCYWSQARCACVRDARASSPGREMRSIRWFWVVRKGSR